jgi:hypothetical protein
VEAGAPAVAATTREERDAARRRRADAARRADDPRSHRRRPRDDRPPAPWGAFPLSELVVLTGIVIAAVGLFRGGDDGFRLIAIGMAVAALGGLEFAVRDHFAGHRSHTTLLAGVASAATVVIVTLAAKPPIWLPLALGALVFALCWRTLREAFKRRSGGLHFR